MLKLERSSTTHSLFSVNGDMVVAYSSGSKFKGMEMIDLWNMLNTDLAVLGNHGKYVYL
jgi:2',3'-cyclic-nucleotide 2'-phosphodiesterase (5'-nucleotidase family)